MTVGDAVRVGDVAQLRALLEAGADPEEPETGESWSPLQSAVYSDQVEVVRLLLDAGAGVNGAEDGNNSPLVLAIQSGSVDVFRILRERGASLNVDAEYLSFLFTTAASYGHLEVVKWLLTQGADVDMTDFQGCSALTRAAKSDQLEMVKELLRLGADPNHRDHDTETVLMWAADHAGNAAVLRALIRGGADVNAVNDMESTALSWAMRDGDPEMVQALLEGGVTIRPFDLSRGAQRGYTGAVRLLLEHGVDPSDPADLAIASNRGHREVANLLRQAAADKKLRDTGRIYPLPRYPIGTHVRTLTGSDREGWIVLIDWHFKHERYAYHIEVTATTQLRKTVSNRYWDDELEPIISQ